MLWSGQPSSSLQVYFIMIHGLEYMGLIDAIATGISDAISQASEENRLMVAVLLLLWVSAIASAFIDNIPYTATMVPVVIELASDPELNLQLGPLAWALALGACLGGNGTIIGASANVVAAGLAEEAGHDISFNRFFKTGFPIMLLSVALATVYAVVRYAVDWPNEMVKWIIIVSMMIASLSLLPSIYGKAPTEARTMRQSRRITATASRDDALSHYYEGVRGMWYGHSFWHLSDLRDRKKMKKIFLA